MESIGDQLDLFGRGFNEIENKEEGLCDYMFSVAIENGQYETYFTEKILDCFATGTIPVYLGAPDIGNYFNLDGIVNLSEEFDVSEEIYYSKIEAVKDNLERAKKMEINNDDWVYVSSPQGKLKAQVQLMEGVNEDTVWTWNAIGKRPGAWALDKNAPEATKGFLLIHLIHELQPAKGDGLRWSNSDPVTGQEAWFDLKVKLEKTTATKESQPSFEEIKSPFKSISIECLLDIFLDTATIGVEQNKPIFTPGVANVASLLA